MLKRKNQSPRRVSSNCSDRQIHDIYSIRHRTFNVRTPQESRIPTGQARKSFYQRNPILIGLVKGGLTVMISVLMIYGIVQAGSLIPSASPAATSFTLSDIYTRLTTNATSTVANHIFSPAANPAATLRTLTEIYNAIPSIDATKVLSGISYLGIEGTMADNGAFTLTASSTNQSVIAGYYSGGTLAGDADLASGNIKSGINIFGIVGAYPSVAYPLSGDTASNDAAVGNILSGFEAWTKTGSLLTGIIPTRILSNANDTVNAGYYGTTTLSAVDTDLAVGNIKYGINIFGISGTFSPYPNTPSGISGLNQTVCTDAGWDWVADSNNDGTSDDPICIQTDSGTNGRDSAGTKLWNMSGTAPYNVTDNTFIGNYGCSGDTDGDGVGTLSTNLTGTVSENTGYGDDANVALAIADCKDGIRNLLTKAAVEAAGYTAPDTDCTPTTDDCYNGPLTPKALIEWKGTRLPSHNDFFGVCGNGTASKTFGNYGNQIGRTDNVITANAGSWEWLSEPHFSNDARVAGNLACSVFSNYVVTSSLGFRAVFRP
jgi:hypothetical protein